MNHYTLFPLHPPLMNLEIPSPPAPAKAAAALLRPFARWRYLSNATCLIQPHLLSTALLVLVRLIEFAASFTTFEEETCVRQVNVRQVASPDFGVGV